MGGATAFIDVGVAGGNRGKIGYTSNDIYFGTSSGSGQFIFKNNINSDGNPQASGTERLRIASDGVATFSATNINVNRNAGDAYIALQTSGSDNVALYGGASSGFRVFTKPSGGSLTERLRIDSNGYVTKPHQPCFQAVVSSGGGISNNSYVTFNSEDRDVGNHFNHTNGIFTAPIAGNYFFCIASIGAINTTTVLRLYLRINNGNIGSGGSDAHLRHDMQDGNAYASNASYTYIRYMSANDTARVYYTADNNSATMYSGADYVKFSGYLIG